MSAELNRIDKRTRELKVLNICLEELEELELLDEVSGLWLPELDEDELLGFSSVVPPVQADIKTTALHKAKLLSMRDCLHGSKLKGMIYSPEKYINFLTQNMLYCQLDYYCLCVNSNS